MTNETKDKKVQLIRPPLDEWYVNEQFTENTSYPVGLCVMAKRLEESGIDAEILDGLGKPVGEIIGRINSDFVGVTEMYSYHNNALKVLKAAKEKGATTIIGGPNMNGLVKQILTNHRFIDYAVKGDGEEALPQLIGRSNPKLIPNMFFNGREGVEASLIHRNAPMTTIFDLEQITGKENIPRPRTIPISSVRGCMKVEKSERCDFCSIDHKLAVMSPELVWKQIGLMHDIYGFDYFWETGDDFIVGNYPAKLLAKRPENLSHVGLKIYATAGQMTEEMAVIFKALNVKEVMFGIESMDDTILARAHRSSYTTHIYNTIEWLAAQEINMHIGFVYGLAGETVETAERSHAFASEVVKKYPISKMLASPVVPLPGTMVFDNIANKPDANAEYNGNLKRDDSFDYQSLLKIHLKHFTQVEYDFVMQMAEKTRNLVQKPGARTNFAINM